MFELFQQVSSLLAQFLAISVQVSTNIDKWLGDVLIRFALVDSQKGPRRDAICKVSQGNYWCIPLFVFLNARMCNHV